MDSDYIAQIEIDPAAKDKEYDFTTEKKIVTQILRTLNGKKLMIVTPLAFFMNRDFFFFYIDVSQFCLNFFVYS